MDPAMGIVGGLLVARWSWGLLTMTSRVLLDRQAPQRILDDVEDAIGGKGWKLTDLHIWEIGPGYRAAIVAVESNPLAGPDEVRTAIPAQLGIAHLTVEVGRPGDSDSDSATGAMEDRN